MIIVANSVEYTISPPNFGYSVIINKSLKIMQQKDGSFLIWDYGLTKDTRILKCTWTIPLSEANDFINIFKDADKARADDVILRLTSGSGFYPFGADKGDAGDFTCRLLSILPSASVGHPEDIFSFDCEFIFNGSYPAYVLPSLIPEGNLQIDTIPYLRYPPNMHQQNNAYNYGTILTNNGIPYTIDKTSGDTAIAELPLVLNFANTSNLLYRICDIVRTGNVTIISPANSYLFGRENSSTDTYTCKLIQNQIEIIHNDYNQFSFNLKFMKV